MDIVNKTTRSRIMSLVKHKNGSLELIVQSELKKNKIRFDTHDTRLPGSPDIILRKSKIAIFVHGCFWHGHPRCRAARLPTSNVEFWKKKRLDNRRRDRRKEKDLRHLGWKVMTVWQCELKIKIKREKCLLNLISSIHS